jgi:UDP-glucose 4-epimerase
MNKTILLSGGCGFIGSHIAVELIHRRYNVVILDNVTTFETAVENIKKTIQKHGDGQYVNHLYAYNVNINERHRVHEVFRNHKISAVIHLAGYKSVVDSIKRPLEYYQNNLGTTMVLLDVMKEFNCNRFIFSSSACVYGDKIPPFKETMVLNGKGITNPYGKSKWIQEMILEDYCISEPFFKVVSLRYFNPIGNDSFGYLGEPFIENNTSLFSNVLHALYKRQPLNIYVNPNDFNGTHNTTCLRDFIHVSDVASAHVKALDYIFDSRGKSNYEIFNIGCGKPISVQTLVETFMRINNVHIDIKWKDKRIGDAPVSYCNNTKIEKKLSWRPVHTIEDACADAYTYFKRFMMNSSGI